MTGWEWLSFIRAGALATLIGVALGVVARGAVRPVGILLMCLNFVIGLVLGVAASRGKGRFLTGWEWVCRWCGWTNRGTDSSRFCEHCGQAR